MNKFQTIVSICSCFVQIGIEVGSEVSCILYIVYKDMEPEVQKAMIFFIVISPFIQLVSWSFLFAYQQSPFN